MELAARGAGSGRDRGRTGRREGGGADADGAFVRAQAALPQALPRASAARARRDPGADSCPCCGSTKLSKLGEDITETLEVIPRQWKVIQTVREKFSCRRLRDDHAAAGALPCDAARLCRAEPAGHDPVREVRPAPAAEPAERALRPRGHRSQRLDAGRPGRRLRDGAAAAACADRSACPGGRAAARRRHHGADPGQGQDGHRPDLDLCPRRPARSAARAAGRALLRLARPAAEHPDGICGLPAFCRPTPMAATTSCTSRRVRRGPITSALCWAHARRQFFELADIAANARRGKDAAAISPIALEAVRSASTRCSTSSAASTA